jgi:hypothetical protein
VEAVSEASFWKYLVKLLPKEGHYSRVESHDTSAGFPDVHYTISGNTGAIELKDAKRPGSKYPFSGPSGLRKSQITWMTWECDAGGCVFLALQCGDRVYILKADLYFDELHRMTEEQISRVAILRWVKDLKGRARDDLIAALGDLLVDEP